MQRSRKIEGVDFIKEYEADEDTRYYNEVDHERFWKDAVELADKDMRDWFELVGA